MIRFCKTCLVLIFLMSCSLYGSDYSLCIKDPSFYRVLLLSSFVDELQNRNFDQFEKKQQTFLRLESESYFRLFRVKSKSSTKQLGYLYVIEDPKVGSIILPVVMIGENQSESGFEEYVKYTVSGIVPHLHLLNYKSEEVMIPASFVYLFPKKDNKNNIDEYAVKDRLIRTLPVLDLSSLINEDYLFEEIDSLSFESEKIVSDLVFSDRLSLDLKLGQLQSISFDISTLMHILEQRYHESDSRFDTTLKPNLINFIQANFDPMEHKKLEFYSYLREKHFKVSHIYSLLKNTYFIEDDSSYVKLGMLIIASLLSYMNSEEIEEFRSLAMEDDFIRKVVLSQLPVEVKESIFYRLLLGSGYKTDKIIYTIFKEYFNTSEDVIIQDQEKMMLNTLLTYCVMSFKISISALKSLKFMIFDSKKAREFGNEIVKRIFDLQKLMICTKLYSESEPKESDIRNKKR